MINIIKVAMKHLAAKQVEVSGTVHIIVTFVVIKPELVGWCERVSLGIVE